MATNQDQPREPAGFKACSMCEERWSSREAFLTDPGIRLLGFQPAAAPAGGLFLFVHSGCGTTLAVDLHRFADFCPTPVLGPTGRRSASHAVEPGFCIAHRDGLACPPECACEFVACVTAAIRRKSQSGPEPPAATS